MSLPDETDTPVVAKITDTEFISDSFPALKGHEAVRKRPKMYIGDTGIRGLHHLFKEIIDNSVDEVLAGHCTEINVVLGADYTVSVEDNGRGIPVDINRESGKTGVELVLTELHAGGKFEGKGYKVSGGLHGVGASCVNALSDWMECVVKRGGKAHRMRFERGVAVTELEVIGNTRPEERGTTVTWLADKTMFGPALNEDGTLAYDADLFRRRIRELAYLNKECRFTFHDKLNGLELEVYHYKRGIAEYVAHLNEDNQPFPEEVLWFHGESNDIQVEVALQFNTTYKGTILSFANQEPLYQHGIHLSAFKSALTATLNRYARKNGYLLPNQASLTGETIRHGMIAILSVYLPNPMFYGAARCCLKNSEVGPLANRIYQRKLTEYLNKSPKIADTILKNLLAVNRMDTGS